MAKNMNETTTDKVQAGTQAASGSIDITSLKYYMDAGDDVNRQKVYNEVAMQMAFRDEEYMNSLSEDQRAAITESVQSWTENHKVHGVYCYTDEELNALPENARKDISEVSLQEYSTYMREHGMSVPDCCDSDRVHSLVAASKYYMKAENPSTQKIYDEAALAMCYKDQEYFATLPGSTQEEVMNSVYAWEATHKDYKCFGWADKQFTGLPSNAADEIQKNSSNRYNEYLTAMDDKYNILEDGKIKEDEKSDDKDKETASDQPKSAWASLKTGAVAVFTAAATAIGKVYTTVRDWVKAKIDYFKNKDKEVNGEQKTAEGEKTTEETKTASAESEHGDKTLGERAVDAVKNAKDSATEKAKALYNKATNYLGVDTKTEAQAETGGPSIDPNS